MTDADPVTVGLVDDHELIRDGLRAFLSANADDVAVTGSAATVAELRASPGWGADVVLLDLDLNDGSTLESNTAALTGAGSAVVVVSVKSSAADVRQALRCGATGYVPKEAHGQALVDAIRAAARGEPYMTRSLALALVSDDEPDRPELSPQELTALKMYAGGMALKQVATRMGVATGTDQGVATVAAAGIGRAREAAGGGAPIG